MRVTESRGPPPAAVVNIGWSSSLLRNLLPAAGRKERASAMSQMKLPVVVLMLFLVFRSTTTRYSSPEQTDTLPERGGWMPNRIPSLTRDLPQRDLMGVYRHRLHKRRCNTATCVTQRLADFLVRSSNTIGTVYEPTNVGSNGYGKRDQAPHGELRL